MNPKASIFIAIVVVTTCVVSGHSGTAWQQAADSQGAIAKRIGTVKTISGNALTLAQASGPEVSVTVQPTARILRLAPGEKDLKNATPLQMTDLHVGDTVRVRGSGSADGNSISALEVIVITQAAVAAVSDQMKQDWQKRGTDGLVESVDASSGNITLSIPTKKKPIVIHPRKDTVVHRYAPDSAKWEDAKPSSVAEIHVGDQLNARGNKSADGSEMSAEEIYAGVFPRFAATVKSVDASSGIVTLQNLETKKTIRIRISSDSVLQKIPPERARMLAMWLKGMQADGAAGSEGSAKPAVPANGQAVSPGGSTWSGQGGMRGNGPPDIQRMLSRIPRAKLGEMNLQRGDAVMVLTTEGTAMTPQTAIRLLSGVEPILEAPPSAQAMMLTSWNLGGGAPGGDGQ